MRGEPNPSRITGRRQAIGLRFITAVAAIAAAIAVLVPGRAGIVAAAGAVALVIGTPLLRVAWLIFRWGQEGDYRFVAIGLGLLGVIIAGSVLTVVIGS